MAGRDEIISLELTYINTLLNTEATRTHCISLGTLYSMIICMRKESEKELMYVYVCESLCCTPKNINYTTLKINYIPTKLKINKFTRKKLF